MKGFTLIELMIVVAIVGILAAIAIPAYQDSVCKEDLQTCSINSPDSYNRVTKKIEMSTEDAVKSAITMVVDKVSNTSTESIKIAKLEKQVNQLINQKSTTVVDGKLMNDVKTEYLFKRNNEKVLTLKRHTIDGTLYACYNDECTKVQE